MTQLCARLAHFSQPRSFFSCFLRPVPPVLSDLSCIPARPMSVSAAATALYKSLPWQPAAPRLYSVISPAPGDTHSLWQAFARSVHKSWCGASKSDALICRVLTCFGKHPVCVERLFAAFSEGRRERLAAGRLSNTTARRLFELAGGSGSLRVLQVDLKLCNQEWKWPVTRGVFHGSIGNYSGGTQLLLCLLSLPF